MRVKLAEIGGIVSGGSENWRKATDQMVQIRRSFAKGKTTIRNLLDSIN
jgi:hypothetical protein